MYACVFWNSLKQFTKDSVTSISLPELSWKYIQEGQNSRRYLCIPSFKHANNHFYFPPHTWTNIIKMRLRVGYISGSLSSED